MSSAYSVVSNSRSLWHSLRPCTDYVDDSLPSVVDGGCSAGDRLLHWLLGRAGPRRPWRPFRMEASRERPVGDRPPAGESIHFALLAPATSFSFCSTSSRLKLAAFCRCG